MNWYKEYVSSLKNIHAEEFMDIILFRPVAFVIVKSLYSLPLTPNHYSLFSFLAGVIAGWKFYQGEFILGAFFFFMFAVLDCCDGMQARMKKNGSEFGRFIDGLVDYSANLICYICLAIGLNRFVPEFYGISSAWLVIAAGVSKAFHSFLYDNFLMEYLSYSKGEDGFNDQELKMIEKKLEEAKKDIIKNGRRILILKIYYHFTKMQSNPKKNIVKFDPKEYVEKNFLTLKMWSLIGPAVHITMLVISFLFMKPEILFVYAIGFANVWMLIMFLIQKRVNQQLNERMVQA